MQDQMRQYTGTQNTAAHETPNKNTGTGKVGDYIDFEEIKE